MSGEHAPLRVGDVLDGFLGGLFGRDGYGPARVEAIGADWVIARDERGRPMLAVGFPDDLTPYRAA